MFDDAMTIVIDLGMLGSPGNSHYLELMVGGSELTNLSKKKWQDSQCLAHFSLMCWQEPEITGSTKLFKRDPKLQKEN